MSIALLCIAIKEFHGWLAARKKKWWQQQQKKLDRHESPDRQDSEQCKRRWEEVDNVQDSEMLVYRRLQREKIRPIDAVEDKSCCFHICR
jgi:hypothetical protein